MSRPAFSIVGAIMTLFAVTAVSANTFSNVPMAQPEARDRPRVLNGVFYCDADWNGNGRGVEAGDVIACIRTALDSLTTNEDGTDNAVTVKLPSGRFDVSSACSGGACFKLKSGIHLLGVMPRVKYLSGVAPDLGMEPDGGTWLDPGPSSKPPDES